jgi:hypothetical protein
MRILLVSLFAGFVLPVTNAFSESVFQAEGCEYRVSFPGPPEIRTLYTPHTGNIQSATYYLAKKETFMRAECIPMQLNQLNLAEFAKETMIPFAENNGLENTEYEFRNDSLGFLGRARGFKTIDGRITTFEILIYFGKTSFIALYMGGTSNTYPAPEIAVFVASAKR